MKSLPLFAFFLVAVLNLIGEALAMQSLVYCTKPLLMPLLALWLVMATNKERARPFLHHVVLAALILAMIGDVLLMFSGLLFFLLGLGAFLLTHLFYIGGFNSVERFDRGFLKTNPWWVLPFAGFPIFLLVALWQGIPQGMGIPVAFYATVLSLMALSVFNLKRKISKAIFLPLLVGALLFLVSDSMVALVRFGQPFPGAPFLIMITYIAAQFLIVRAVVDIVRSKA